MTATEEFAADEMAREFAAALDACHERAVPGDLVVSPEGWTTASAARMADGTPAPGGWPELRVARREPPSNADQRAVFADELLRLQRQTIARLLHDAVRRLDERTSDGANLLNRQLVRGAVADVALALSEVDDLVAQPGSGRRRWRIHRELVAAGRVMIRLYGASGFVADGPGRLVYVLELLGNIYLHPGRGSADHA